MIVIGFNIRCLTSASILDDDLASDLQCIRVKSVLGSNAVMTFFIIQVRRNNPMYNLGLVG